MLEIRLCEFNEIDKLQKFIDLEWKKDHIFVNHTELLKWQHSNNSNNQINFVLGYDTLKHEIVGILGFIPLYQFDCNLFENKDFWLAIWKIKNENKGIGLELLNFIINTYNPNSIGSIGINQRVKKLYNALKFKTGKLIHYCFINPNIDCFQILKISQKIKKTTFQNSEYKISRLHNLSNFRELKHQYNPYKSIEYIENRYSNHPIYKYQLYGVFYNNNIKCILVTRKIILNNSACIRIVDIYGDLRNISTIESELVNLLTIENCEYIDCLNFGIESDVFLNLGFSIPKNIIIPHYFEPFEPINVDIQFAYLCNTNDYVIFKGDSDLDRPNVLK